MISKMHDTVVKGNYKVTEDTRVIPIVEHEDEKIQWSCSISISKGAEELETLKEAMTRPNGHLWKKTVISEVKKILSRKACILTKRNVVKATDRKLIPVKWVFNSNE